MKQPRSVTRVGFVSSADPEDEKAWSGMLRASRNALASQMEVVDVRVDAGRHSLVDRILARGLGSVGYPYLPAHGLGSAVQWGRATTRALRVVDVDAVVAVAASSLTAFADVRVPLISVSDSTFAQIATMYPSYQGLPTWARIQAEWVERRAWRRSDACVVSSKWAADSLIADYGIAATKCQVVPFGPGVAPSPDFRASKPADGPRLLLIATDWRRKRGDRALETLHLLHRMGLKAQLTVVGTPKRGIDGSDKVTWLPRCSHSDMAKLYASHDIVLDLAAANCASVTLVDAAAWGLPAVATDVGAAREIVIDGVTGFVVPSDERTPEAAANAVAEIVQSDMFRRMNASPQDAMKGRLTWSAWAHKVTSVVTTLRTDA